jgi:outer membrane assembly lipoprotein YfiO
MPRSGPSFLAISVFVLPALLIPNDAAAAAARAAALAPTTWERGEDGQWRAVDEAPAKPGDAVDNATLDEIEQLLAARKHRAARKPIIGWVKANPAAPDRDRGLFLLAEMYNQAGDKVRAFYHLDELMDYYPSSRLFYPALEKQYGIAERFLSGYRQRFLGMAILSTEDEGVEILFRIQERAPGSPIAERALLRTADHYYDDSQFDLAADAYAAYARSYPRSPELPRVRLQQAFASLAQFRGLTFDATPVVDAKAQLEDVRAEYPDLAAEANVAGFLERVDGILAARVYQTADFYRRTNEPRAAVYNWRYLIDNYPDTPDAERARRQLERMPQWALELPAPGSGGADAEEQQLSTPPQPGDTAAPPSQPPAAADPVGRPPGT